MPMHAGADGLRLALGALVAALGSTSCGLRACSNIMDRADSAALLASDLTPHLTRSGDASTPSEARQVLAEICLACSACERVNAVLDRVTANAP